MSDAIGDSSWQALQTLFLRAIALGGRQREEILREARGRGERYGRRLQRMLAAHDREHTALDRPVFVEPQPTPPAGVTQDPLLGQRVGKYLITDRIGVGGLGAVYRALQEQPRRWVAIKLPRFASESPDLLVRLEFEAEILGHLQHPCIAQIIEAGSFGRPEGPQPFLAMELVDGPPLTEYAQVHKLPIRARIELLIRICEGVEHAHQRGVIHRDLKPANILVVDANRDAGAGSSREPAHPQSAPLPKILDFGIARWTTAQQASAPHTLSDGQIVGTLAYMGPEQLAGQASAIGTPCDIYALGVIAFELLSGRLPLEGLSTAPLLEAMRIARDARPLTLSQVAPALGADLNAVVCKAMNADRALRYASAAEFAADLTRYLHDEPVLARPPTIVYQLRRFARRNRALVAGTAATLLALIAGLIGFAWKAEAEARQRAVADTRLRAALDSSAQMSEWVENGLSNLPGSTALRLDVAEAALARLVALRADIPATSPASDDLNYLLGYAHQRLGEVQLSLDNPDAALRSFQAALRIREQPPVSASDAVRFQQALVVGLWKVGDALVALGRPNEALAHLRAALTLNEPLHSSPDENGATAGVYRGLAHQRIGIAELSAGRPLPALNQFSVALGWFARGLAREPENLHLLRGRAQSLRRSGEALIALERWASAQDALSQSLDTIEQLSAIVGSANVWERIQRSEALLVLARVHARCGLTDTATTEAEEAARIADFLCHVDVRNAEAARLLDRARCMLEATERN
ncbi:MAG: serine/threonine-protein kinase [Phycisphaerae bacterium]